MKHVSPLRYPGGKARLAPFLQRLVQAQSPSPRAYAEPFAGGVGAGLKLLQHGTIDHLLINDINPGIAAFWRACIGHTGELCELIKHTPVNLDTWHQKQETYFSSQPRSDLELGFATFFLNRTNHSGILDARPIGGLDQKGKWKIDARYNKTDLIERIKFIAQFRSQIEVYQDDAKKFLERFYNADERILFYVDPPYLEAGKKLYLSQFSPDDHSSLTELLSNFPHPWVLTYDDDKRIYEDLYANFRLARFKISHSANINHLGSEIIVFSDNITIPDMQVTSRRSATQVA